MTSRRRVAITGYGTINALGIGVEAFEAGLRAGRCAIGRLTLFSTEGYRSSCAAEVAEIPPIAASGLDAPTRRMLARASRTARLALVAADEALRMAGIGRGTEHGGGAPYSERSGGVAAPHRPIGVVLGTTTGGMASGEERVRCMIRRERDRGRLADWLETPVSAPTDHLAHLFAADGPRLTVSTACSSSANALGIAADWIRIGRAEAVLCGGSDALCRMTFSGFNILQAIDREPCRPFDRDRAGLSLGEGAAMFVLEDWQRAEGRGARILAELVSYGVSADAHHLTQPRPDGAGAILALRRALDEGGVVAEEIDHVNAHGTGTPQNDAVETRALKAVLGRRAYEIPVTSTKSMVGHTLGAAGAIEALASVLAIRGSFVPPTATLRAPDPECDLDYVPGAARAARLRTVLSSSYGFGGNNTSLIVRGVDARGSEVSPD